MAHKQKIELSLDAELVAEAKAAGTDLSALLETALREASRNGRAVRWREENREAIVASKAELAANGPWHRPSWLDQ
jgi:antitoxin CcdA